MNVQFATRPARARGLWAAALATVLALSVTTASALARDAYVQDGAALFSQSTVSALNSKLADFNSQSGKEVVVVTVPSLDGATIEAAAESAFAQQQVNGVLFFLAKAEQKDIVVGDRASRAFFPAGSFTNIHNAMRGYFRDGDFDTGITTGVNLVLDQYRSHQRALAPSAANAAAPVAQRASVQTTGGSHVSFFWLLLILLAGFLIIRAVFRAMSGPRMMPPGYGPGQGPNPGYGPGYGGPGYGYGGGGGGSFFSGLLGGLGGAFLGNELFGNRGGQTIVQSPTDTSSFAGGGAPDSSGFQSDPGQADMGNAGGGDWSSGGGFDAGSSGFDGGGGGGFDAGGGGDSGGGW